MTILSAFAYMGFCALVAYGACRARFGRSIIAQFDEECQMPPGVGFSGRGAVAALASLSVFFFLPLGRLPSLVPVDWGGATAILCLAATLFLLDGGQVWRHGAARRRMAVIAALGFSLVCFAWYGRQWGVPGEVLSLDTYVAMPLARLAAWRGKAGIACLALAGALASCRARGAAPPQGTCISFVHEAWHLAVAGIWTALFMPAGLAPDLHIPGVCGLAADAAYFWLKIAAVCFVFSLAGEKVPDTPAFLSSAQWVLSVAGGALLALE